MNRRPTGVTLSAAVLGIFSFFLLLGGLFDVVVGVLFISSPGLVPNTPGQPAPPPNLLPITFGFMALMTLICAAWGIITVVGLVRMRRWARISIMIIGGCIAGLFLLELFGCLLVQFAMKNFVLPPNAGSTNLVPPNPQVMQGAFFFLDAVCVIFAAIGIWWLIYFARRKTGQAFAAAPLQATLRSTVQLNPATPITDFSVAQPLQPAQPSIAPAVIETPPAPTERERPISMIIVAVLLFLGSLSLLMCCFLPFSMFFFGIQFSGWSSHVLVLALAALNAAAGYGLLKRMHIGWLLAVGVQLIGMLNILTLLAPPVRTRWMAYTESMAQSMMPAAPPSGALASTQLLQQKMMTMMLVPSLMLGFLFGIVILVLLWRARWAYTTVNREVMK